MDQSRRNLWPDNYKFALGLSHDVDETKKTYQYLSFFLKTLKPYHILSMFYKKEPYWNFERIMEVEQKYNVRSTFFFLNQEVKYNRLHPSEMIATLGKAQLTDSRICEIIKILSKNGWEIALHGSYESFDNVNQLKKEKVLLEAITERSIFGVRQHYLRLKIPETWLIQKSLGFTYDASFGSNKKIGFPDNKQLPFKPFSDSFLVIPLTIMDYVLFSLKRNFKDQLAICEELINRAEANSALIVILWHQRVFNEDEFPNAANLYENIIKMSIDKGGWVTTLINIAKWWQANDI